MKKGTQKVKLAEPERIKSNFIYTGFCLLDGKLAVTVKGDVLKPREAKRLHTWLGQAIEYMEREGRNSK